MVKMTSLIISGSEVCNLSADEKTTLIQASLVITALATLLQLFPAFREKSKHYFFPLPREARRAAKTVVNMHVSFFCEIRLIFAFIFIFRHIFRQNS